MSSGDRFYQLELRHRPALHGDIGSLLKIEGIVVGGGSAQAVLMLPGNSHNTICPIYELSQEQWTDYLQRADSPEVLVGPSKAFHRKVRYEISGFVQQKVWLADGLKCMYCDQSMGKVPLTIDHFIPLEMGGANDTSNYLSACRKCNKDKGSEPPRDWCGRRNLNYDHFIQYLATRKVA